MESVSPIVHETIEAIIIIPSTKDIATTGMIPLYERIPMKLIRKMRTAKIAVTTANLTREATIPTKI
jgi:hypothetical protein